MPDGSRVVPRSSRQRSAITNCPSRLPGVDGRSAAGRRWRDIVEAIIGEFGDSNTEAVREFAGLRFAREQVQASAVTGSTPRAAEDLVRIGRLIVRVETTLRQVRAAQRDGQKMSIPEYLSWRDAQRDVQA